MKNRLIIFVSSILVVVSVILIVIGVFNKRDVKSIDISPNINNVNYNSQFKDINPDSRDIDISQLDIDIFNVDWFSISEDTSVDYYNVCQYLVYAIRDYYDDNVTDKFKVSLPLDIFDNTTNMIFNVRVHGDNTELIVFIDMYNNKVKVTEVIK